MGRDSAADSLFEGGLTDADVRAQLERILASAAFRGAVRRREFLRFVVEETLAGRGERLKGVAIASAVFGRDETFDPQLDPIVRLEARRLRRDLDGYYAEEGRDDPIRIFIRKGGYVPTFERRQTAAPAQAETPAASPDSEAMTRRGGQPHTSRLLVTGLFVLAFAIILAQVLPRIWPESAEPAPEPDDPALIVPHGPSVAILPFVDLSGDTAQDYFADGISEQLATELARFRNLRVLWLGSIPAYRNGLADPRELRRALDTDYVIEGRVRMGAGTIRITARLIQAADAEQVWVKSFEEPLDPGRIYEVQDAIAGETAGNIAAKYGVVAHGSMAVSSRKPPESLDAYDCVLRYYAYQITIDAARHSDVRACLERTVEAEPDFAEAWAVLANVYMQHVRFGYGDYRAIDDPVALARTFARRATTLDPGDSTGYMVLSNLLYTEGDINGFKAAAERALRINPNETDLLGHYGTRLALNGNWERGLALIDKAMAINPAHPGWFYFPRAFFYYDRREYERALAELNKIDMPTFFWTPLMRAATLGQLGRADEAEIAAGELLALKPSFLAEAMTLMKLWHFEEGLLPHIVEGLRKAGLDVTKEVASQG